jgi:uncharacterized membrane protein YvlD (DUF360 family)
VTANKLVASTPCTLPSSFCARLVVVNAVLMALAALVMESATQEKSGYCGATCAAKIMLMLL